MIFIGYVITAINNKDDNTITRFFKTEVVKPKVSDDVGF